MYLQALWQAKEDANALVKLEEKVRHYDLLLFAAVEQIKQLKTALAKSMMTTKMALASMSADDLRWFALANTFIELTQAQLLGGQNNGGAQHAQDAVSKQQRTQ